MKILLIRPPSEEIYQSFLPLGLAYIAGSLIKNNHEVTVWDLDAERWTRHEVSREILHKGKTYGFVGISALGGQYAYVKWLANTFRKTHPYIKIILGGHLASALPEFMMQHLSLDFVAVGEGEETMVELAGALENGSDPSAVNGIFFRNDSGDIVSSQPRTRIQDLDQLSLPPWDLFPMDRYLEVEHPSFCSGPDSGTGLISIMASRGCPFDCIYCDHTVKGYRPRYRSVRNVLAEIKALSAKYGNRINTFYFWDDILIWDRDWTREFCEALIQAGLNIRWTCNCHVRIVEPGLMRLMKEAGCENVRFGIESGSQKILDALNKGVKVEDALAALQMCLNVGLSITTYLMVGMTGEDRHTIDETVDFFKKLIRPTYVQQVKKVSFAMLTPFPGTKLFEMAVKEMNSKNLEKVLLKKSDAHYDIPLNISGRTNRELLLLKRDLENRITEMVGDQMNNLRCILYDMQRVAEQ